MTCFETRGEQADIASLTSRASELASLLQAGAIPFTKLIGYRIAHNAHIVVVDVSVEVDQVPVVDILPIERMSIEFSPDDGKHPAAFAMRKTFPLVPHLISGISGYPRQLCLFEEPWHETRHWLTPTGLIDTIRNWLAATARQELHAIDQPLEPLLFTSACLIVPFDISNAPTARLDVQQVVPGQLYVAKRPDVSLGESGATSSFVAAVMVADPQPHGIIQHTPRTLEELEKFLQPANLDVIGKLKALLDEWRNGAHILQRKPVLVLVLPKQRQKLGQIEANDVCAFFAHEDTVGTLGEKLGIWQIDATGNPGHLLRPDRPQLDSVSLLCLNVQPELSMEICANTVNRVPDLRKIVAIGQGALGSQTVANLVRLGFGSWTLIDKDILLPHNLIRHALVAAPAGLAKAAAMQDALQNTVANVSIRSLICDVLNPGNQENSLDQACAEAAMIIDFSASVAVARHLASKIPSTARRVSIFLSPDARHLVMLAEDEGRDAVLDHLEAIFQRLLIAELRDFYPDTPTAFRYGRSCGDVSTHVRQDRVALHAAIAAGALQELNETASVSVWRIMDDFSVQRYFLPVSSNVTTVESEGWTVSIDGNVAIRLREMRSQCLPYETGGVLVGMVDHFFRRVHVADVLSAPPDSQHWPNAFIRGWEGLPEKLSHIHGWTSEAVCYVGEWHSHPSGVSLELSNDDERALDYVTRHMKPERMPGILVIVGDTDLRCHVRVDRVRML